MNDYSEVGTKEEKKQSFGEIIRTCEFWKGISTVFGAILVNLIAGSIFGLCTLVVYQISYIKGIDKDNFITIDHIAFYYPFEVIFQCLSAFLSGIIEKKIGLQLTNLLGFSILGLGYFIMFLSKNFFIDILSMIVGGIGTGIIYYPSTKNACLWFIDHSGIVIGILETMISLGSFFFALIGEKIINIKEEESHKDDDLYDLEVAQNVKKYLVVQIICVFGVLLLSFLLMYTKKEEESNTNLEDKENIKQLEMKPKSDSDSGENNNKADLINKDQTTASSLPKGKIYKKKLKVAVRSKRLILYAIISIFTAQGPSMMFTLYRGIGEYKKIDTGTLQLLGSVNFVFECLSGIITGILCDYVNLKLLLLIIGAINTSIISTYCFTFTNDAAFFWITNFGSFFNGAIFPYNDCYMMKVFGAEIYIELLGYVSFLTNFVVVLLSPFAYFIESGLEVKDNAYWILFSILGGLNLVAFVLSFFINTEPFDYEERLGLFSNKIENNHNNEL